jgi:hypothetical protein
VLGHTGLAAVAGVAVQGAHLVQANTAAGAAEAGGEGSVEQHTLICGRVMTSNRTRWYGYPCQCPESAPWAPPKCHNYMLLSCCHLLQLVGVAKNRSAATSEASSCSITRSQQGLGCHYRPLQPAAAHAAAGPAAVG